MYGAMMQGQVGQGIPGKVQAAQQYLFYAQQIRNPPPAFDGCRSESQDWTRLEATTYEAALRVLLDYFKDRDTSEGGPAVQGGPGGPPFLTTPVAPQ